LLKGNINHRDGLYYIRAKQIVKCRFFKSPDTWNQPILQLLPRIHSSSGRTKQPCFVSDLVRLAQRSLFVSKAGAGHHVFQHRQLIQRLDNLVCAGPTQVRPSVWMFLSSELTSNMPRKRW
jgi:hypothetical protein